MTDKNIDQAKGRVKEAAGALTGDRRLKGESTAGQGTNNDTATGQQPRFCFCGRDR